MTDTPQNERPENTGSDREPLEPRDIDLSSEDSISDYLWDGSGEPDAEVVRLEVALRPLSHRAGPMPEVRQHPDATRLFVGRSRRRRRVIVGVIAATILVFFAGVAAWWGANRDADPPSWEVLALAGTPTVGERAIEKTDRLREGDWLTTGERERAAITVATIGSVTVEPESRLRLVRENDREKRLELARGTIRASIIAPPRLFIVDTPGAVAADMGCAYDLTVADDGSGVLHVTSGWVELDGGGRLARVPAGFSCVMTPGQGPGLPIRSDASSALLAAVASLPIDRAAALDAGAVGPILAHVQARDAVTLWHLITATTGQARGAVVDQLAEFVQLPESTTLQKVLDLDPIALDEWWEEIRWSL